MNTLIYKMVLDIDKISHDVVQLLRQNNNIQLSTAESCTGGGISHAITGISGSSDVFGIGICAYANSAKEKYLYVNSETLKRYGAVSRQTALEMAQGAITASRNVYKSDNLHNYYIGISTTGISGPTGGSIEKPVGTVHFACVLADEKDIIKTSCLHLIITPPNIFTTDDNVRRNYISKEAIRQALVLCRDTILLH